MVLRVPRVGKSVLSPLKKRNVLKTRYIANSDLRVLRKEAYIREMKALLQPPSPEPEPLVLPVDTSPEFSEAQPSAAESDFVYIDDVDFGDDPMSIDDTSVSASRPPRQPVPGKDALALCQRWKDLLPNLHKPYLNHIATSTGVPFLPPLPTILGTCSSTSCIPKTYKIICLFLDRFEDRNIVACSCASVGQVLVGHGLFPTSPLVPRTAIAIPLLDLYQVLFERSCDAVTCGNCTGWGSADLL